jgi:RNA polymerase sigma-70 factor, ECF subfamily
MTALELRPAVGAEVSTSDGSLLRRFRSGEEGAATNLYMRYARRLIALARKKTQQSLNSRVDPEDVVQSVFRTFFRRVSAGNYVVPEGNSLWQLLLVIALNKIRTLAVHHRAAKRDVANTANLSLSNVNGLPTTNDETALHVLELTIEELLEKFPSSYAPIVKLRIEGHDVAEIAARTGRSKRTVERVLQTFRSELATIVHDELGSLENDHANYNECR